MSHITEYITKSSRPKKHLSVIWGSEGDFTHLYKKQTDIYFQAPSESQILSHATNAPLFTEVVSMWICGEPSLGILQALASREIFQPVTFECITTAPPMVLEAKEKSKVQMIGCDPLKPGSKLHKDFLVWVLAQEFSDVDPKVLRALSDVASPYFGVDTLKTADNLRKFMYYLDPLALSSEAEIKAAMVKVSPKNWLDILQVNDTTIITAIVDALFAKSRSVYSLLNTYFTLYDSPLPLLKALQDQVIYYIDSAWAIKESHGSKMDPQMMASQRLVPSSVFNAYQTRVLNLFGERNLWSLLKELCISQSRYRNGETSKIMMYSIVSQYVGNGI